ncbi:MULTISPECIES: hypothetical protein [Phyllobacterium]|jgi:hypothetical protein|uniref:hypothetical protein n=1 Tax=Phyllobacterium TaxID=28100 RepID=UPI0011142F19|nr:MULTISPECIES: hypothetical protein [Phyllobacterium]
MEKINELIQMVALLHCDKMTMRLGGAIFPLAFAIRPARMRHLPNGAFNARKKAQAEGRGATGAVSE